MVVLVKKETAHVESLEKASVKNGGKILGPNEEPSKGDPLWKLKWICQRQNLMTLSQEVNLDWRNKLDLCNNFATNFVEERAKSEKKLEEEKRSRHKKEWEGQE